MSIPVLLVHGGGGGAYEADASLADSLRAQLGVGYDVHYPAMPNEDEPDYNTWRALILNFLEDANDAMVVGHSIGASVLAKMATETILRVRALFLVAGPYWYDDDFWRWDEVSLPDDAAALYPRQVPLFLYHGKDDDSVPIAHLSMYAQAFPTAVVRALGGRDHQLNNDMTEVASDIRDVVAGRQEAVGAFSTPPHG